MWGLSGFGGKAVGGSMEEPICRSFYLETMYLFESLKARIVTCVQAPVFKL